MEIEKKYLLSNLPSGLTGGVAIRQGYLSIKDPEIRVRAKGERFFITQKGGEGFVREEVEDEISQIAFQILWGLTKGARIEKVRYNITGSDGLTWEVDEYLGGLAGLYTAEVELPTEATEPCMPESIAQVLVSDVTTDKKYKNKNLAR